MIKRIALWATSAVVALFLVVGCEHTDKKVEEKTTTTTEQATPSPAAPASETTTTTPAQ